MPYVRPIFRPQVDGLPNFGGAPNEGPVATGGSLCSVSPLCGHRLSRELSDWILTYKSRGNKDGVAGDLDFENRIVGRPGVFRPLVDVAFFAQIRVDPDAETIVLPNGVDICPDVLHSLVTL